MVKVQRLFAKTNLKIPVYRTSSPGKPLRESCFSSRCLQHVFDENSIPNVRRVDQDVGDGADELAVLDDGAAGHE